MDIEPEFEGRVAEVIGEWRDSLAADRLTPLSLRNGSRRWLNGSSMIR